VTVDRRTLLLLGTPLAALVVGGFAMELRRRPEPGYLSQPDLPVLKMERPVPVDETVVDITWGDLVPEGVAFRPVFDGIEWHGTAISAAQPSSSGLQEGLHLRVVRLSGYIIPLDLTAAGVTAFLLVPFVGACIHVPPPPANQLVLVTTEVPYPSDRLFEPVRVTGVLGLASISTDLAEIGYAMSADQVEPLRS